MSTIIQAEGLGKKYVLRHQRKQSYYALRDVMADSMKRVGKKILHPLSSRDGSDPGSEEFWALKDLSFEIREGDRVGIIGRNGAGKSTLLKILSRITEPTRGRVGIRGRVASLLEVGTGFHPELTGRENIYLNGAILGMSKADIRRKFDEIVDFAEVEKFLDTPVKRYSSGMYVRLAFAVAAHLEPEILLVDEVLAVGDAQFQKKCLGKMESVSKEEGRTVIFVSHNMGAISDLCNKGIVLTSGKISYQGDVRESVSVYNGHRKETGFSVENCSRRGGSGGIRIKNIWIENSLKQKTCTVVSHEEIRLNLEADVSPDYQTRKNIVVGFGIDSLDGKRLLTSVSSWRDNELYTNGSHLTVRCKVPFLPFVSDRYLVSASISIHGETLDYVEHCTHIDIIQNDSSFSKGRGKEHGSVDIPYSFEVVDV